MPPRPRSRRGVRWAAVFPAVLLIAAIVRAQPEGTYRVYRFGIPVAELTISPEPDGEVRYLLAQRDRASGV